MNSNDLVSIKAKGILLVTLILLLIALVLAWRWSSLSDWLAPHRLVEALRQAGAHQGTILSIAYITLASVTAVPLGVIIVVSSIAFGPWLGSALVISGACIGSVCSYGIGSMLGHEGLCRFGGERLNRLSEKLAKKGILSVVVLRMLPVAPFAIVNMVAGASHIRIRDFLIGTALGMLPGTLILSYLSNSILIF
ncbi:MAG: TVP38/TMEM64 family protein [Rhodocyclaceae bacterium]|nr:TVP38/TMEM64 family protein [Rhodocyclaceae bacterium]